MTKDELISNLNLLYRDTEGDDRLVDLDFIEDCKNVLEYLIKIGVVQDDGTTFRMTVIGDVFVSETEMCLPWLKEFLEGVPVVSSLGA